LTVTASATSVDAGGSAVTLTATVSGAGTDAVARAVSGPGSLSSTSGGTGIYNPPRPSELGNATSTSIIATCAGVQKSLQIALTPASGSTWQVIRPPMGDFAKVRYLGGRFYAISANGVLTSV